MNYLVTKKWMVIFKPTNNMHHYSVVVSRSLVDKKDDPGAFTISFTIGSFNFLRALYNLGASINLMKLIVYKQVGFGAQN